MISTFRLFKNFLKEFLLSIQPGLRWLNRLQMRWTSVSMVLNITDSSHQFMPSLSPPSNMVYSPHFYDLDSLFSQVVSHVYSFNVQLLSRGGFLWDGMYFGKNGRKKNYSKQIGNIVNKGYEALGEIPIIIGEIGLPFDVNKRVGMRTGNWNASEMQYDAILSALETHMIGYKFVTRIHYSFVNYWLNFWSLWNYNPHNTYGTGDDWNFEDFSIYSLSSRKNLKWNGQGVELYDGIRVLEAIEVNDSASYVLDNTDMTW